jgi:hypothetical protein
MEHLKSYYVQLASNAVRMAKMTVNQSAQQNV